MFYDFFDTGLIGKITLVADEAGLRHIEFEESKRPLSILREWRRNPELFKNVKIQLEEYFNGRRQSFDLALAPVGTTFQQKVWQALRDIPYGTFISYKTVAENIGNPKAVRAVGGANGKNPIPIVIPCHRVIGSDGSLTGFGGGLKTKKILIDLERRHSGS